MTRPTIASAIGRATLAPALVVATLALTLAATACKKQDEAAAPGADAAIAAVNTAEDAQIAAINGRDLDGAVSVYAPDAVFVAPNEPAHTTPADIRSSFEMMMKDPASAVKKTAGKRWVSTGGDMIVTTNDFELGYTDPKTGKALTAPMTAATSWQKQADGAWKIVADYNALLPPKRGG